MAGKCLSVQEIEIFSKFGKSCDHTDVWQRTGGRWVQIARQATILKVDAAWVYGSRSAGPKVQQH
jgi:hypothetical protein